MCHDWGGELFLKSKIVSLWKEPHLYPGRGAPRGSHLVLLLPGQTGLLKVVQGRISPPCLGTPRPRHKQDNHAGILSATRSLETAPHLLNKANILSELFSS